ncbi:phasin family protein [Paraburkholderia sediminicola]|uniref:Phasin family protein n=1 Tax=Paraburkholderia rhynchosiae TaxID=487049 RepID=A0ACC7NNU1_9BURK
MSSLSGEQVAASRRASLETLSDAWTKAFGCIEKRTELNLRAVKSTLAENQAIANLALSTKDPQQLFALQARRMQAAMQEAQSYWRHVNNIMFNTQAELAASAEAQLKQQQQKTHASVATVASNASAGSEAAVSVMQSAVTGASEATGATIEAGKKAAEQAREIAKDNVEATTSATNKATQQAVEKVRTPTKK